MQKSMHVHTGPLANTSHPLLMLSWKSYSSSLIPSASFSLISPKWWKEYVVKWDLHLHVTVGLGEKEETGLCCLGIRLGFINMLTHTQLRAQFGILSFSEEGAENEPGFYPVF